MIGVSYAKRRQEGLTLNEFAVMKPTLTAKYLVGQVGGLPEGRATSCDLRHLRMRLLARAAIWLIAKC